VLILYRFVYLILCWSASQSRAYLRHCGRCIATAPSASTCTALRSWSSSPLLFEWEIVILDFSGVHAVDGGGLGTFALLQLYVRSSGRRLRYCCLRPCVNDLIKRIRLNSVFDICGREEEAVRMAELRGN
jgi:anti-anti-sigma regulatory factor